MRLIAIISITVGLIGCASTNTPEKQTSAGETVVGGWLFDNHDFSQSFTLRRSDGSFTQQRFQVESYSKAPVMVVLEGKWAIEGKRYCVTYDSATIPSWKSLVGQTQCSDVVKLTTNSFQYLSQDGLAVSERRVTQKEMRRFERYPFTFLSDAARARIKQ